MPRLDNTTRAKLRPGWAQGHLRLAGEVQFCPQCWTTAAYQRLRWIPRASAICLEHGCLLGDRCQRCGKRVSLTDLLAHWCSVCRADLRQMHVVSIAHDRLGVQSQQVIQSWFNAFPPSAERPDEAHLPPQPPMVLYHLLQHLAPQLLNSQAEWSALPPPLNGLAHLSAATKADRRHLTPQHAFAVYRSAFAGLMNWPEGFFQWLDAFGGCDHASPSPPCRGEHLLRLQRAALKTRWQNSPLAFVQQALVDYLLARQIPFSPAVVERFKAVPWFVERTGLWTETQAAQALGISLADLRWRYVCGSLDDCLETGCRSRTPIFKRDRVLARQPSPATSQLRDAIDY